jgi:hypothetical protein
MTALLWFGGIALVAWLVTMTVIFAAFVRAMKAGGGAAFEAERLIVFESMRDAAATARRETEPGGPSVDLGVCRDIWPDAPSAAGEDGAA